MTTTTKNRLRQAAEPIVVERDDRRYRVLGLEKNLSAARLTVNVKVERGETMYVDRLDLYSDRQRRQFLRRTSEELYVDERLLKSDLACLLRTLEERQAAFSRSALEEAEAAEPELTPAERDAAEALLADPQLIDRIGAAFDATGLAGEEANRLACYLACTSRLLTRPLGVLVQSSSAAGKTTLLEATLSLMPAEAQVRLSAMTGQSLYYLGQDALKHKILAVAEDEGVAQASYALKLLQSEGRLTLAAAEKDGELGRQTTRVYEVEGPCALLLTTTAEAPDAELANRCLTLHVNETADQTAAIHARQRAAYAALPGTHDNSESIRRLHQNAQRLLEPLAVHIPWAEELSFRNDRLPMRRAHAQYLTLIAASAVLHQRQRKIATAAGVSYVVAEAADAALAGQLAGAVLGGTLEELLPQTRRLLVLLDDYVAQQAKKQKVPREGVRFTQRSIREALGYGDRQLRRQLTRLVELEYVLAFRTGQGNGREYALLYQGEGRDGAPFVLGLADPNRLAEGRTGGFKGPTGGPPAVGRRPAGGPSARRKMSATTAADGS